MFRSLQEGLCMNYIDFFLLLVVLLAIWAGWQKGFILGTINLLVWLGSLAIGFFSYKYFGSFFHDFFPSLGVWTLPLSFIVSIVLARIILGLIFNSILRITPDQIHTNIANHFLGIIPGFINGIIYATIFAAILLTVPLTDTISEKTRESQITDKLAGNVAWLDDKLSPIFNDAVKKSLTNITIEPGSEETVKLNFTVKNPQVRADLEAKMLQLVNEERIKRGLQPLKFDRQLVPVARAHSKDMFERGYFSHYTLEGKDPFERMREAGVNYYTAGENLALGRNLQICHEGLMNSPGHRANILNPSYGRIGIGILDGGAYGLMISQEFRN